MGTTLNALNSADGVRIGWVCVIEGYEHLLTDSPATAPVTTAWSGSGWSSALTGLRVDDNFEQSIAPLQPALDARTMRFTVLNETFGRDAYRRVPSLETETTADHDADDTTINVKSTSGFSASGEFYLGIERITYSGKTATTFTGCTRGLYAPFAAGTAAAHRFGRVHRQADVTFGAAIPVAVTDVAQSWTGKQIGLWLHRIVGDTWDAEAQAQLVFAGRIIEVQDGEDGATSIVAQDYRARLNDCVLFSNPFRGRLQPGVFLAAGAQERRRFDFSQIYDDAGVGVVARANPLIVVESGASGTNEVNDGVYVADDIVRVLNAWLQGEVAAARLIGGVRAELSEHDAGPMFQIVQEWPSTIDAGFRIVLEGPRHPMRYLGFAASREGSDRVKARADDYGADTLRLIAEERPFHVYDARSLNHILLESTQGEWVDQSADLPGDLAAGGVDTVLEVGGGLVMAARVSDTAFSNVRQPDSLLRLGGRKDVVGLEGTRLGDDIGAEEVRQVLVMSGNLADLLRRFIVSTGTAGYNHATYDDLPAQLGAAVPWTLLGDDFDNTVTALAEGTMQDSLVLVIRDPTRLSDIMLPHLQVRDSWLVWKQGGYRVVSRSTPLTEAALVTLNEDTRAVASGQADPNTSPASWTSEYMVNVLKIEHSHDVTGNARDTTEVRNQASIDAFGETKAMTIVVPGVYGVHYAITGAVLEELVTDLYARVLPVLGRPMLVVTRTIGFNLFEQIGPGDIVNLTDDYVRDPATGLRGITDRPALVLGHRFSWGGDGRELFGEVDLMLAVGQREAVYSPSAQVDETENSGGFSAGYDAAARTLRCHAHKYSNAAESADPSHFAAGDAVRVVQINPATPAGALAWERVVESVSGNDVVITVALSAPAFDSAKLYRIVSDDYDTAAATQQADAYQADDAAGYLSGDVLPYLLGSSSWQAADASTGNELPERHESSMFGDTLPVAAAFHDALVRMANNLHRYKTAPQGPIILRDPATSETTGDFDWIYETYVYVGQGELRANATRFLRIAPMMRSSSGGQVQCRVTVSSGGAIGEETSDVPVSGQSAAATFSTTSTTRGTLAEQDIDVGFLAARGWGYLTIELAGHLGTGSACVFDGLAVHVLEPMA